MTQFDILLRQGLMDANLEQYGRVLQNAEAREPDFSPRYLRERMRLLADPQDWERRRELAGTHRKTRLNWRVIAIVAALLLLSACAVAVASSWLREITRLERDNPFATYTPSQPEEVPAQSAWRPAWLPEGWTLEEVLSGNDWVDWKFQRPISSVTTIHLDVGCYASRISFGVSGEHWDLQDQATVQGRSADYYEGAHSSTLIWEAGDGNLICLMLSGRKDRETLEQIAESMTLFAGEGPDYEASWLPEGCTLWKEYLSAGAGQISWERGGVALSLLYVKDPICPFAVPDRKPEEETVNGLPALFWPSLIPVEEKGPIIDNSQFRAVVTRSAQESAVLTWEDPESNTRFCIRGILEREDVLRLAESVTEKSSKS